MIEFQVTTTPNVIMVHRKLTFLSGFNVSFNPYHWSFYHTCCSTKTRMCETQYSQIVDDVGFHSCCILNYVNITNAWSHFTVDSSRFLESLSSRIMPSTSYNLTVLLVSIVSIHSSQFDNHVVEDEQTMISTQYTSNIVY